MIPIQPILTWASKTHDRMQLQAQNTDNRTKKLLKLLYNKTLPPLAAAVVAVVSVPGLLLAGVVNVLTYPYVAIHKRVHTVSVQRHEKDLAHAPHTSPPGPKSSMFKQLFQKMLVLLHKQPAHYPQLKDFDYPPPSVDAKQASKALSPYVQDANFPIIFPRSTTPLQEIPLEVSSWPVLNKQKTNSLSLDFLQSKTTIPGTQTTFWGLLQRMGTKEGHDYLDEQGHKIFPVLFPAQTPSPENKRAPVLSRELLFELQTNPNLQARYIANFTMALNYFGLTFSSPDKKIIPAKNFAQRAKAIKQNKHKEVLLQQMIASLGYAGFGHLALQLSYVVSHEEHQKAYGLSPACTKNILKILDNLYQHETSITTQAHAVAAVSKSSNANSQIDPKNDWDKLHWHLFLQGSPSVVAQENKPLPYALTLHSNIKEGTTPLSQTRVSAYWSPNVRLTNTFFSKLTEQPWDANQPCLIKSQEPEQRLTLTNLQAPSYFFAATEEKKTT